MHRYLRLWGVLIIAAGLLGIAALSYPGIGTAQSDLTVSESSPDAMQSNSIVQGVHIPPIYYNNTEVSAYNQLLGKNAGIVMVFYSWDFQMPDTHCGYVDMTLRRPPRQTPYDCGPHPTGPEIQTTLMFTWEPNGNPASPYSCPLMQGGRTNLDAVINGQCDAYIDEFARRIKSLHAQHGDSFMLRLAHEMNISSSVWFQDNPDYPAKFVAFWRHVVDRFRAVGVSREAAQFVWSPNYRSYPAVEWNAIPNYYPGDEYVEWVGLSGYNWYGTHGNDPNWLTFDDIYDTPDPMLEDKGILEFLHCAYAKPIVIAEIGTVDGGTPERSKAAWIRNAMQEVWAYPFVKAIVWFNDYAFSVPGNADFRISQGSSEDDDPLHYPGWHRSLGQATDAWREGIAHPNVIEQVPPLADITPDETICSSLPQPQLNVPNLAFGEPGETLELSVTGMGLSETSYQLRIEDVPAGFNATFTPPTINQDNPYSMLRITIPAGVPMNTYTLQAFGDSNVNQAQSPPFRVEIVEQVFRSYLPLAGRESRP